MNIHFLFIFVSNSFKFIQKHEKSLDQNILSFNISEQKAKKSIESNLKIIFIIRHTTYLNENLRTIQTTANKRYLYLSFNQLIITIKSFALIEHNRVEG